jgi:hypothetical protein
VLLKKLTTFEDRLVGEGIDVYHLWNKMCFGSDAEYQESLIAHLQTQGPVPPRDGGYMFVEPWRILARKSILKLQRIWKRMESRGEEEVRRWLDVVEMEEEWADLMDRLVE